MALDSAAVKELIEKLDADRQAYLTTLTRVHETLARALAAQDSGPAVARDRESVPPSIASSTPPRSLSRVLHEGQLNSSLFDRGRPTPRKASVLTGEESEDSDEEQSFFVQETLPAEVFTEHDLRHHLRYHAWQPHGRLVLGDVLEDIKFLDQPDIFEDETEAEKENPNYTHASVYEIGPDGAALPYRADSNELSKAIWQSLRNTNSDPARQRLAVGKIAILREPSTILFGAAHLTMDPHFDMDTIYRYLSDESPTKAYMNGCFAPDPRRQRSYLFCFKYHTIVGGERQPLDWQTSDENLVSNDSHIPISTASSVVALSLSGGTSTTLKSRSRKSKSVEGHIFDPFSPWRVLTIQAFADWESNVDTHESNRHYVNGPEAFLVTLLAEYRDATKRFEKIRKKIVNLASVPSDFIFNQEVRDSRLFEDDRFTFSRRYFWASQTLAIMNDNITHMLDAYKDTFTDEVWNGEHKYIWPGTKDQSPRYNNWRKRMANLRKQFETEILKLENVLKLNFQEQKDITSLRDQLFSGTSVFESRQAVQQALITVQQGHNIKLLTLVSIFFLPLTFVTSVFSMSEVQDHNFHLFAIITASICAPTYFFIGSLNTHRGMEFLKGKTHAAWMKLGWLYTMLISCFRPRSEKIQKLRERYVKRKEPPNLTGLRRQSRSLSSYQGIAARGKHNDANSHAMEDDLAPAPAGLLSSPPPKAHLPSTNTVRFDLTTFDRPPKPLKRAHTLLDMSDKAPDDQDPLERTPGKVHLGIFKGRGPAAGGGGGGGGFFSTLAGKAIGKSRRSSLPV